MALHSNLRTVRAIILPGLFFLYSCAPLRHQPSVPSISRLRLIDTLSLPYNLSFQNTTVGGLSSIDYDERHRLFYMISDDRSSINPARFYTARIGVGEKGFDSVHFVSVTRFLQPGGQVYPNSKQDPERTPDPESLRYNPSLMEFVWGSEGERIVKKDVLVLEDPSVIAVSRKGRYRYQFPLPSNMHMQAVEKGPRQNGVFEGITFLNDYKELLVNVEEPLYEDGPRAGLGDSTGWIRIIRYNVRHRKPIAQYGYRIDAVAYPANPPGAFKINGVPDILAINSHQLLVTERSFSTGHKACTIKLYLAELDGAEDVSALPSLNHVPFHFIQKKLLLNLDDLGFYVDNVEGATFGPRLPNGHRSLILVADNNFDKEELSQFFLFEVE